MTPPKVILIVGSARAGTTALTRILDTATNAEIHVEHDPKLCRESRLLREGRLTDPTGFLRTAKSSAIDEAHQRGLAFGDKNPNYLDFLPHLPPEWDAHVVFVVRDGRDVVRSLLDWHEYKGVIYNTVEDDGIQRDQPPSEWDFSWPRPQSDDPSRAAWASLSRFEKCAWYWSHFYRTVRARIDDLPEERRTLVDMTRSTSVEIRNVFDRLGLAGYEEGKIARLLGGRINSLPDRTGEPDQFPRWPEWPDSYAAEFDRLAGDTLREWGYK